MGLVALLAMAGGIAVAVWRVHLSDAEAAAGLAAALAAWWLHAGLDWDWEMPAVTLPMLMLAAAAIAASEAGRAESSPARGVAGRRHNRAHGERAAKPATSRPRDRIAPSEV